MTTSTMNWTAAQQAWFDSAMQAVDEDRLRDLTVALVDRPSPPGGERALAEWIADRLTRNGVEGRTQVVDTEQANAVGRIRGDGTGPDLLLYAPIDTLVAGSAADIPWAGPRLADHMLPGAEVDGDLVVGLGAGNPKGHAACVIAAAEAVASSAIPLTGDLVVGLGAGGMPTNAAPGTARRNPAQGIGCSFMLEQGVWADRAVIAKPGWSASWEEVGLCWFRLVIHGTHTYVGSRHLLPYRNPIVDAATVITGLERWATAYTERHTSGLVAPQVNIGAVRAGWPEMPSVSSAACVLTVDVRLSPRSTPTQVRREMLEFVARMRADHPGLELDCEMFLSIPGSHTPEDHPVVRSAIAAWEAVEGRSHQPATGMSGGTDANILRNRGIPTVRIGMPKATLRLGDLDFQRGMNTVSVRDMVRLTEVLVRIAIDTCTDPGAPEAPDGGRDG